MIKKIELVDGVEQTIAEKLEVIRLKINSIIELVNKNDILSHPKGGSI